MSDTAVPPSIELGTDTTLVHNPYTGEVIASVPTVDDRRRRQHPAAGQVQAPYRGRGYPAPPGPQSWNAPPASSSGAPSPSLS